MTSPEKERRSDLQTHSDSAILYRIEGEYREMPGLNLTLEQGARLWAMPPTEVLDMLDRLVELGVLRRNRAGKYIRA